MTRQADIDTTAAPSLAPPGECDYCGASAEGNHAIHRDGFCVGPEVPLCDACGGYPIPTCEDIWERIALPSSEPGAWRPL